MGCGGRAAGAAVVTPKEKGPQPTHEWAGWGPVVLHGPRVDHYVVVHALERCQASEHNVPLNDTRISRFCSENVRDILAVLRWNQHHVVALEVTRNRGDDVKDHQATTASMAAVMSALSSESGSKY